MKATFAAGCFWGIEEVFRQTPGVLSTRVGYTGGHTTNPTYREVCSDQTGHAEAVEVEFDPEKISYKTLLDLFWNNHNPTTLNRQGPDIGSQYRSAIFFHQPEQEKLAIETKNQLAEQLGKEIVTEILPAKIFYPAEEYHQQYLAKKGKKHC
jgi:peptide-methionine (S)-S-oxide reductase